MSASAFDKDLDGAVRYLIPVLRGRAKWAKNWSPEAVCWLARHTAHWARQVLADGGYDDL